MKHQFCRMSVKAFALFIVLLVAVFPACQSDGESEGSKAPEVDLTEPVFEADRLLDLRIEIAPADWDALRTEGRGLASAMSGCAFEYEYTYIDATVTVDGETLEHAAVRKKGSAA